MRKEIIEQINRIQVLTAIVERMKWVSKLGLQYDGLRDIYLALGYPKTITFADTYARYLRQDIARAIIDKPVEATWSGGFFVEEVKAGKVDLSETTVFEQTVNGILEDTHLKVLNNMIALDKLVGLGRFGILLFGLSDVKRTEDFMQPVSGKVELLYLKAFGEGNVSVYQEVQDVSDKRYGQPLYYQIMLKDKTLIVHYSRVIHVSGDGALMDELYGYSRLEPIYNRLIDIEKVVGGSAEMYWRGARPGYMGKVDASLPELTPDQEEKLKEQLDEYEHNLRRFIITQGIDIQSLQMQIANPKDFVDVQIQMIAAQTGIPKRILTGSERGELASTEDKDTWNRLISARRAEFAEMKVIKPFIRKLIELGIAPKAEFRIVWKQPVFEQSTEEKAKIGEIRARALASYASQPTAESIIPPSAFYKYFLGLSKEEIEDIASIQEALMAEEEEGEEI